MFRQWERAEEETDMAIPECRKCRRDPISVSRRGAYLELVNEKGAPGVWQCNPSCDYLHGGQDDALLAALGVEESSSEA